MAWLADVTMSDIRIIILFTSLSPMVGLYMR